MVRLQIPRDETRNLTMIFDDGVQTNAELGELPENNEYGRRIVPLSARLEFRRRRAQAGAGSNGLR